jgi:hypothetical protein
MEPVSLAVKGISVLLSLGRAFHQRRRKLRVTVHRGYFVEPASNSSTPITASPPVTGAGSADGAIESSAEYFFIKMTNLSPQRELEVTHLWFETQPRYDYMSTERPPPFRLRSDETVEVWVAVSEVARHDKLEYQARARLSNGKVVKSRVDRKMPPTGLTAGRGIP